MQKYSGLKLRLGESENLLKQKLCKAVKIKEDNLKHFKIVKKSLDARNKNDIFYTYNVEYSCENQQVDQMRYPQAKGKVVVVGAGPCGLFCALYLARCGITPIVLERGESVENRSVSVDIFSKTGKLNCESNVQFGEGGAGAFSDGKLNTQVNNEYIAWVLKDFVTFGAPCEIEYLSKPHIGSDKLPTVVKNIRENVKSLGGRFIFNAKVTNLIIKNQRVCGVEYVQNNAVNTIECDKVVLAIGHSSRDTFEWLYKKGVKMEQKAFAVGLRIEHLQDDVGFSQYGKAYKLLPSADYKVVSHASQRSVFSFCMCPGGYVMPASSENNMLAVNGMSLYKRDGKNANSAIVCEIKTSDFESEHPLSGVNFQRQLESKAFIWGGGEYKAPVQLVGDFLKGKNSANFKNVIPTYPIGTNFARLDNLFNKQVVDSLKLGIADIGKRLEFFKFEDAVLTGVESRTSSPLRILRDLNGESVNIKGLYPAGEGCGYAGGITSASVDGLKTALKIATNI